MCSCETSFVILLPFQVVSSKVLREPFGALEKGGDLESQGVWGHLAHALLG